MPEIHNDIVEIRNSSGEAVVRIDNNSGEIVSGGYDANGTLILRKADGSTFLSISSLNELVQLGGNGNPGTLFIYGSGTLKTLAYDGENADLIIGTKDRDGSISLRWENNKEKVKIDSEGASIKLTSTGQESANIEIADHNSNVGVRIGTKNIRIGKLDGTNKKGSLTILDDDSRPVIRMLGGNSHIAVGREGNSGKITLNGLSGSKTIKIDGEFGNIQLGGGGQDGDLSLMDESDERTIHLNGSTANAYLGGNGQDGDLIIRNERGDNTINLNGSTGNVFLGGNGQDGDLIVRNERGDDTIHLNGSTGDIILLGSDFAEDFDIANNNIAVPGMLYVLDKSGSGLKQCDKPYDKAVVGVCSGAGNYKPGLIMDRLNQSGKGRAPIAMVGKVACFVDADPGSIQIGDLLTTSGTIGHAMRAKSDAMVGTIFGKALGSLKNGQGLINVLVNLQ